MPDEPKDNPRHIETHGGAYIEGEVDTAGGDFIGRDKIVGAVGEGARGLVQIVETYVEREFSHVELAAQAQARERKILAEAVAAYIGRLGRQAAAQPLSAQANPYKALLEYDLQDAALFYGRRAALRQLLTHLQRDQLTVLHSESGAGKTSLLKAGLMPHLLATDQVPLYLRPYGTPVHRAFKDALLPTRADLPVLAAASLLDFLRQVTDLLGGQPMVVIVDQFEEVFTVQDPADRAAFIEQLASCLADDLLPVRWIFAVRGEWLSQLGNFRPQIRRPFENEVQLRALNRDEAREVIVEPAAGRSVKYEPALVDQLLDDLGREEIAPPQLQLVCTTLFAALDGQTLISRAIYEQAGEAAGILRGHLERVLERDLPAEQRKAARHLLEALVTSEKHRALRHRDELAGELDSQGINPTTLDDLLEQLVDSRILRVTAGLEGSGARAYELAHDYLLKEIELDPAVRARKAAQELLAQELLAYKRHKTLLSEDKLVIIEAQLSGLTLDEGSQALVEASRRAMHRQRRLYFAGAGVVLFLVLLAIVSVALAFGAQSRAQDAESTLTVANLTSTIIALDVNQALTQLAYSEEEAQHAVASEATSEAAAALAITREQAANLAIQRAYELTGVVPIGTFPSALAWDGANLWVANRIDNTVQQIDPLTGTIIAAIPVGDEPTDLVWDGASLWVAIHDDYAVEQIDPLAGTIMATIQLVDEPSDLAWDGTSLWVATGDDNTVQQIDPLAGTVITTIRMGDQPFDLAWGGTSVWVANSVANTVQQIDPLAGLVLATIPVGVGPRALVWDGASLWVANSGDDTVQQIDPLVGEVIATVPVGVQPSDLALAGASLWVANSGDDTVQQIDPLARTIIATIPVGDQPTNLAWDGASLWVANQDDTVQRIDAMAATVITSIRVGALPNALVWDGASLWVATGKDNSVQQIDPLAGTIIATIQLVDEPSDLAWDGTSLWVANSGDDTVQQIDPLGGTVIATIPVGVGPRALEWDGASLWVANSVANTVQQIDPLAGLVLATIPVGNLPNALEWDGASLWVANSVDFTVGQIYKRMVELLIADGRPRE